MRKLTIAGLLVVLVLGGLFFVWALKDQTSDPQSNLPERVVVRLKWLHQAQFAGFYVAKEKGYYSDAGIDVALEPGGPNFPAIQSVVSGGETFGVTGADQILLARSKDADVVPLLVIYQRTPFVLFVRSDSGIDSLRALTGRPVGVKLGGNEELTYRKMMAAAGIDTKSVREIPVQFDMAPFFNGNVVAWPGYSINEPLVAQERGVSVRSFTPDSLGIELYGDVLFTTKKQLERDPGLTKRFVEATRRGWQYAIEHPEEAAAITMKYATDSDLAHQKAMMSASLPLLVVDQRPFGDMTISGWEVTQETLVSGGVLSNRVDLPAMLADSATLK